MAAYQLKRTQRSAQAEGYRHLYDTAAWKRLRIQCFVRDNYTCQRTGKLLGGKHPAPDSPVANHIKPHRGDRALFFSLDNLETVSKKVHDGLIQADESRGYATTIGLDGWPTDNAHPSNIGFIEKQVGTSKSHPVWFRKSFVPVHIVCGPPGSGKSTYVDTHAGPNDRIICFDRIATKMFGKDGAKRAHTRLTGQQVGDVLRARNELIADLMWEKAIGKWPAAWIIVTEARKERRQWWADKLKPRSIMVLETPAHICKQRVIADAQAGDARHANITNTIDAWWKAYKRREGDLIITPE